MNVKKILLMIFVLANANLIAGPNKLESEQNNPQQEAVRSEEKKKASDKAAAVTKSGKIKNALSGCYNLLFSKESAKNIAVFTAGAVCALCVEKMMSGNWLCGSIDDTDLLDDEEVN